jgi:hypothetical protein
MNESWMNHGFMIPFAEGSINIRLPGIVLARQLPLWGETAINSKKG